MEGWALARSNRWELAIIVSSARWFPLNSAILGGTEATMKTELSKDVWRFLDDDKSFTEWCHDNPDGSFWNCGRNPAGDVVHVYTLHSAMHKGKMCPHFRNGNRASGFEDNLTTTTYCKVVSVNRKNLEKWARAYQGDFFNCSSCVNLP